ncbi:MAG: 4Fe-4S dicluster domain-containing protein [Deltaproteobacteria bacterium]
MKTLREFIVDHDVRRRAQACYQCGVCVGGCPVGRWREDFNPRRIVEMIVRDELEELVGSEAIWLCSACFTCLDRCPQKIEVTELITHVKNVAARLGNVPEGELKKARIIVKEGWAGLPVGRTLKQRAALHLPELDQDEELADLKELMKAMKQEGVLHRERSSPEKEKNVRD